MDIAKLNHLCLMASKNGLTVDISHEFAVITTDIIHYQQYASGIYNNCTVIDRYGSNIKTILNEYKHSTVIDRVYDPERYIPKFGKNDGVNIDKINNGKFKDSFITITSMDYNVNKLRFALEQTFGDAFLSSEYPIFVDGPIFDDLTCRLAMTNITLGPVAMISYNNHLVRQGSRIAAFNNNKMYQDNLHLLNGIKILNLHLCNCDLPVLPLDLEGLFVTVNEYQEYRIVELPKLILVRVMYYRLDTEGHERGTTILFNVPILRKLIVIGHKGNTYIEKGKNVELEISQLK